jgi:glutamyl-tRNA reductase
MHFILLGLNHETAPVELREKLAFHTSSLGDGLLQLTRKHDGSNSEIDEGVIVSTCNRVEIYATAKSRSNGIRQIKNFISSFHKIPLESFEKYLYVCVDTEVAQHLFSVASGLRSMILGESQIQGQIKDAFDTAQKFKTVGPLLSALFRNAITVGKRVRSETTLSEHSASVSHAAVKLVKRSFEALSGINILVIGIGKMSLMAVKALLKSGASNVTVINRTEENVKDVAQGLNIKFYGFDKLRDCLKEADVVISSTGAPHIVLSKELVSEALANRLRSLLIVDMAVPRDVDPHVSQLESVQLFNIDQIKAEIDTDGEKRCAEMNKAKSIINEEIANFAAWRQSLEVTPVITDLKTFAEDIQSQEVDRALRRLQMELPEHDMQVVQELARRIVNKMLHQPIVRLRAEAVEGNGHAYTAAVRNLFGLENRS